MVKKVLGKFVIIIRFCYFDYFQILHYYLVVQLMITLIIDHFTAITFMAWFTVYTNSPVLIYFITKKKLYPMIITLLFLKAYFIELSL